MSQVTGMTEDEWIAARLAEAPPLSAEVVARLAFLFPPVAMPGPTHPGPTHPGPSGPSQPAPPTRIAIAKARRRRAAA